MGRAHIVNTSFVSAIIAITCLTQHARADDWPQWLGPNRDAVWRETGILKKFPEGGPKVIWKTNVGGGYAGPAVANGRVYINDRKLAEGARVPRNAFAQSAVPGRERVLCLDEKTGKEIWVHQYDCTYEISYPGGPRTTPVVTDDKVYSLGAMGDLRCLNADTGELVWAKNFRKDYDLDPPMWGWAASPLLDGDRLICMVGGQGSTVVAFHKDTGEELWRNLTAKEPGYCPPMIFTHNGQRQLIIWHPESVNGLDPHTGKLAWSQPFEVRAGLSIPTPRYVDGKLFVTAFYNGPMMLSLSEDGSNANVVWKGGSNSEQPRLTKGLHSIMVTPFIDEGHIYGVCSYGEFRCLEMETGKRLWATFEPTTRDGKQLRWANAFIVKNEDRYFLFNENGDLIVANLSPDGYEEIDRVNLLKPTGQGAGRPVLWSHPAFANKHMFARNDEEIICVSLEK